MHAVVARNNFQVKMYKAHQGLRHFWSWDVEKVHAVVARSTFRSQKCKKLWGYGELLDVQMCFRVAGARDCAPCQKWAKSEGLVAFPKTMAGVGHLKRICKDGFSVAGAGTRDMLIRDVRRSGRWFPERGLHFGASDLQVLLRWFCVTGAALRMTWCITFSWQAQYFRQIEWNNRKNALVRGRQLCTQLWIFEGSLAELFVFDVINFEKMREVLADLFRFLMLSNFKIEGGSRRIASLLTLSSSKPEDVSQNSFVFKLAGK